jgi:hypothetical protein
MQEKRGTKVKKKKKKHVGKATMHGGHTVAIHSVIFEKNKKINPQPAQYEKNKIDKDQFEKKRNKS